MHISYQTPSSLELAVVICRMRMPNAERSMHCLFAVSFPHVCLWLTFIYWKGQHYVVFGPFQQIKAILQANMSETNHKQTVHLEFGVLHSAFGILQNIPAALE